MKKFLAMFAVSTFAVLGLSNCGGGGDSSGDSDGDGALSAVEFWNGAGLEFKHNPIFKIERGNVAGETTPYDPTKKGNDPNYASCNRALYVFPTVGSVQKVTDAQIEYIYDPDAKTASIEITLGSSDLEDAFLGQMLGQTDAVDFAGGEIKIDVTFNGADNPSIITVTATPANNGDDDEGGNNNNAGNDDENKAEGRGISTVIL